jgi:hypothetical protein
LHILRLYYVVIVMLKHCHILEIFGLFLAKARMYA